MSGNEAMPAAKSKNGDCVFNRDSTMADVQVNDAQPARAGEAEIQLVYTAETLMPLVLANAPQGSAVVSAFTKFYHANENDLDGQIIDDVLHAAQVAMSQWAVLPEELRERYANGWYMPVGYPTVSRFFAEESSHDDLSTAWFIQLSPCPDGHIFTYGSYEATGGTENVRVHIRAGASKTAVVVELIDILSEITRNWDQLIQERPVLGSTEAAWAAGRDVILEKKEEPRTVNTGVPKLGGQERKGPSVAA